MKKKLLPLIAFQIISSSVFANYNILLMGGGGEPTGTKTIFDSSLKSFAEAKKRINANISVSFNGGHSETEDIVRNELKTTATQFTKDNYEKMIQEAIKKIKRGQIKSGEQLVVIVDTHGGMNTDTPQTPEDSKELTHSLATTGAVMTDMNYVRGNDSTSMDQLIALTKLAQERGINLGIIDMSCHSGSSLKLSNPNTCVISSTGPKHFGYTGFAQNFYNEIKPGLSLEEVFLSTRKKNIDHGFPMISTPSGEKLNQEMYPLFTPFIYTRHDDKADKITGFMRELANADNLCSYQKNFETLLKQVETFEKVNGVALSQFAGTANLKKELIDYKKLQENFLKSLSQLNYKMLKQKEVIKYSMGDKNKGVSSSYSEEVTVEDLIDFPENNLISMRESLARELAEKKPDQEAISMTRQYIASIEAKIKRKHELVKQYPDLLKAKESFANIKALSQSINDKAFNVSELARRMYDHQYQALASKDKENNPCKKIKF